MSIEDFEGLLKGKLLARVKQLNLKEVYVRRSDWVSLLNVDDFVAFTSYSRSVTGNDYIRIIYRDKLPLIEEMVKKYDVEAIISRTFKTERWGMLGYVARQI